MDVINLKKQKLLVEYLISSTDIFLLCLPILKDEYFDPMLRKAVRFIIDYYNNFSAIPNLAQISAETGVDLKYQDITRDKFDYVKMEMQQFCSTSAAKLCIMESIPLIEQGKLGEIQKKIQEAATISLDRDIGSDFFIEPVSKIENMFSKDIIPMSTGWKSVDRELDGGIGRKELTIFVAPPSGGKSISLSNLGLNFQMCGKNVLYLSMEMAERMVGKRSYSLLGDCKASELFVNRHNVARIISENKDKWGDFIVKRLPVGTTSNKIRGFLKEFELQKRYIPDIILVDYLDLMHPNEKIDFNNINLKDKLVSEQVREIGEDYNIAIVSASQMNREGMQKSKMDMEYIAGGITKANTADNMMYVDLTPESKKDGIVSFYFMKTRNSGGRGVVVQLKWNNDSLRILDADQPRVGENQDQPNSENMMDYFRQLKS